MARKKVPRKSYEREFQKFSSVRPFYILYILLCGVCVIIYVTFSSDRSRGAAVPVLINATHSRTFLVLQQLFCQPH